MAKPYIIDPKEFKIITKGQNADVYLSKDLAIKVPKTAHRVSKPELKSECGIQNKIFSNGHPVPEPDGIHSVYIKNKEGSVNYAFFMERIHGTDLENYFKSSIARPTGKSLVTLSTEAEDTLRDIENNLPVKISENYGLHSRNVMYDFRNKRVVLVDFGNWKTTYGSLFWIDMFLKIRGKLTP